jgi:hypothetical protein
MVGDKNSRGRIVRRLATGAVLAAGLTGVAAAPAFAAHSGGYATIEQCRTAQVAYGASSFIAITKPCYAYIQQIPGGWDPNPAYRFDYRTRY